MGFHDALRVSLAAAALVAFSAVAQAQGPVRLTDSQLDSVTAGKLTLSASAATYAQGSTSTTQTRAFGQTGRSSGANYGVVGTTATSFAPGGVAETAAASGATSTTPVVGISFSSTVTGVGGSVSGSFTLASSH